MGIVWLFKVVGKDGHFQLGFQLLIALGFFVLAILLELLHYIVEIIMNAVYLTDKMKDKEMPTYLSSISWLFLDRQDSVGSFSLCFNRKIFVRKNYFINEFVKKIFDFYKLIAISYYIYELLFCWRHEA